MTKTTNNCGFTIIELVVVIAIIAVLATIVMTNVTQYQSKAKDAAIKEQVRRVGIAATDYFLNNETYAGMCEAGTKCSQIESNISNLGGQFGTLSIKSDGSAYCMDFVLSDGVSKWCTDSSGYAGSEYNCTALYFSCQ